MYIAPEIDSSYAYNNLGHTLYNQILYSKPEKVIDFGVLNGYSTICIAQALKELGRGKVYAYDLFEDYEYKHSRREILEQNITMYGLRDWVEIGQKNFFDWIKDPEEFDALHLDISNTGDIVDMLWDTFKESGKTILFEGGSEERDKAGWMVVFNKKPIRQSKAQFEVINNRFPSISKLCPDQN